MNLRGLDPKAEPDMADVSTDSVDHYPHPGSLMARMPAACVCGWHPKNHPGYILADHLRDFGALA